MGRITRTRERKVPLDPLAVHIGRILLSLRQKNQVTIREVADGAEISGAFVCDIENGKRIPGGKTIWKLACYFDVPPGYFFRGYKG